VIYGFGRRVVDGERDPRGSDAIGIQPIVLQCRPACHLQPRIDQGQATHRRFIPGGTTTGFPNQIPGGK
jgi:hypothetical protein